MYGPSVAHQWEITCSTTDYIPSMTTHGPSMGIDGHNGIAMAIDGLIWGLSTGRRIAAVAVDLSRIAAVAVELPAILVK